MLRKKSLALPVLHHLYLFLMMLTLAGILSAAAWLQYAGREIPCPLCLLQRLAMFGVAYGIIVNFRHGYSARNDGVSMIFALLLLIISVRQTLLDIYPRPGHEYIGSAIFGIHMPVWSILIATALLIAFALKFVVFGNERLADARRFPALASASKWLGFYMVALCVENFVSVIVQCGLGACHTWGYLLLG
jgi:disulfide bond formation protein DsbB